MPSDSTAVAPAGDAAPALASKVATPRTSTFLIVWLGQLVSYTGSGLTGFALAVWAYETTGSITQMTLIAAFTVLPTVLLSPVAGACVDRWDRRRTLIFSDAGAGLSTLAIAVLLSVGRLQVWHVYVAVCVAAVFGAFRWPALSASTTQLVPKSQFGRASGLLQVVQAGQALISPVLAGLLMARIHLEGIVVIDVTTFAVAVAALVAVRIPPPARTAEGQAGKGSILREMGQGLAYIRERPALFALLAYAFVASLFIDMASLLLVPLVLGMASAAALGTTLSLGGVGFLVGGGLMSAWGGPKRPIHGVLGFPVLAGLFLAAIGLQSSLLAVRICLFGALTCLPLFYACNQAIWQRKVPADIQGRVFAIRRTIVMGSRLVAGVVAGPLADDVLAPLLREGGPVAEWLAPLVGQGPGAAIRLLFVLLGSSIVVSSAVALLRSRLWLVDSELADAVGEPGPSITEAPASTRT